MAKQYDLVVLGAGVGGYVAAIRASQLGLKTAIVEKQYWGGVCLNVGCIPSKALLRNAELVHIFKDESEKFGISVDGKVSFDYGKAFKRSREVSDGRVKGVHFLMRKNKIDEFEGWATFTDPHTMEVALNAGGKETLTFTNLVLDTGATTRLIPNTQLSANVVTYEEQIMEEKLPKSIIIAGGGAIGCEFAYVHHNYGVDVTIVEFLDHLLPLEDEELSTELEKQYKKQGIKFMTKTRVDKIEDTGTGAKVTVTTADGKQQVLENIAADRIITVKEPE